MQTQQGCFKHSNYAFVDAAKVLSSQFQTYKKVLIYCISNQIGDTKENNLKQNKNRDEHASGNRESLVSTWQ